MLPFFITIDTEGDCLWKCPNKINTENVLWIPRFQELCEKYKLIPIWLTDYEVAMDDRFVDYMKPKVEKGLCEIGIHVHAANNPPLCVLSNANDEFGAYLIEYPYDIMKEKFELLKQILESKFATKVITHRAGRWTLDERYKDLLLDMNIKYDCSVTPGIDWSSHMGSTGKVKGSNYKYIKYDRYVLANRKNKKVIEYPMAIINTNKILIPEPFSIKGMAKSVYKYINKKNIWLRANPDQNTHEMKAVLDYAKKNNLYAEFMIHSSELMPGGAQKEYSIDDIDKLYYSMEKTFEYAINIGFEGHTFDSWEKKNKGI